MIELHRRAQEIFERALDTAEPERRGYIDTACEGDASLRALVDELFAVHAQLHTRATPALDAEGLEPDPLGFPGGRYRVIRAIGEGGMGTVYLCRNTSEAFDQEVAVKVLRQSRLGTETLQRFARERAILSQLDHPGITAFIDGDTLADGRPYVVMAYTPGAPITGHCDENALDVEARVRLFLQLCEAVEYAHRNLIIHRDIKPANVLVDAHGQPRLLDFGIARLLDQTQQETATGFRVMTPAYASPEHIRGQAMGVASDVYSLGVLLFQLLSGHLPYDWQDLSPAEYDRLLSLDKPPAPSERLLADATVVQNHYGRSRALVHRRLHGDLDRIAQKALRTDVKQRYATVGELADDLQRWLNNEPVKARDPSLAYRAGKFIRRNALAVGAAALVLTLSAAFVWLTVQQNATIREERDAALRERERAGTLNEILITAFKNADPTQTLGREVKAIDILEQSERLLARRQFSDPELKTDLTLSIAEVYSNMQDADKVLQMMKTLDSDNPTPGSSKDLKIMNLFFRNAYSAQDETSYRNALTRYQEKYKDAPVQADLKYWEAVSFMFNRDHERALELLKPMYDQMQIDDPMFNRVCNQLASQYSAIKQYETAIDTWTNCLNKTDNPNQMYDRSEILKNLGRTHAYLQQYAQSDENFRKSLSLRRELYGEEHISLAPLYMNLGLNHMDQKQVPEAIEMMQKGLSIYEKHQSNAPLLGTNYFNLSLAMFVGGMMQDALETIEKAEAVLQKTGREMHYNTGFIYMGKAAILIELEQYDAAIAAAEHAMEIFYQEKYQADSAAAEAKIWATKAYTRQGHLSEARRILAEALPYMLEYPEYHDMRDLARELAAELGVDAPEGL